MTNPVSDTESPPGSHLDPDERWLAICALGRMALDGKSGAAERARCNGLADRLVRETALEGWLPPPGDGTGLPVDET